MPEPPGNGSGSACDLCGLPLGRTYARQESGETALHFCCPGCQQVYLLLSAGSGTLPEDFRRTELYEACVEAGIIPGVRDGAVPEKAVAQSEAALPPLDLTVKAEGMWCPTCAWLIQEVLQRTAGVVEPHVSFLSDVVHLRYLPHMISPDEIMSKISRLGYRPALLDGETSNRRVERDLLVRLAVSAILSANIMMVSMGLYLGFFHSLSAAVIGYFSYPLLAMATPVVFYGGFPILKRALAALRYGGTSMETLISVGMLSAYGYSVIQVARGGIHLYFETAAMLVTLVLLGRYIEMRAREKVSAGIMELYRLANQKVRLNGVRETWVMADAVRPGDQFVVCPGERVPLDGEVLFGETFVDESMLTGESRPVNKGPGDEVMGGSILQGGEVLLRAVRTGKESSIGQMIRLVEEALQRKNPVELLADRIARVFVPAILAIACATGLSLWFRNFPSDEILLRSLTVLLISCPCALGIATPLVKVAMIGVARTRGILVREPSALERVRSLDTLMFDKTGTLTEGHFRLEEMICDGWSEKEALLRLASLESHSGHFLAKEIVRKADETGLELLHAERFEVFEGLGVKGGVNGVEILIGNRRLMCEQHIELPDDLDERAGARERSGKTVVFFGWDGRVMGFLAFGDPLRPGVKELVRNLHSRGIAVWMVSGDARATTRAVAESLAIAQFRAEALPEDKVDLVRSLQQDGRLVGMVGDGMNDAAALAQADVGFALGTGSNIIQEASDLTFLAADPARVLEVFRLSALTAKTMRQNLFFSFVYNGVAIPVAAAGLLNPLIAIAAMFASSFMVIGNALRISTSGSRSV